MTITKKASEPIRNKIRVDKTCAGHQPCIKKQNKKICG
jgi:hypothetical protein